MSKKCLVVDDVTVSCYANRSIVEALGFEAIEANSAESCLAEVRKSSFDVIILDWHLRRESGLDLIQKIRALPGCASTVIIVCTGVENADAAAEARKAGANGYIVKPSTREKIEAALNSAR